jgi:hypothetical protein
VPKNGINVDSHATTSLAAHATVHATNQWSTSRAIEEVVASGDLDLDDTMVLMHSEFGRYHPGGAATGTEHWTRGYPMVLIGGPVRTRRVRGALSFSTPQGVATGGWNNQPHNPTDVRCAVALAAGLDPFGPDMYALTDTSAPTTSAATLRSNLEHHLLGL